MNLRRNRILASLCSIFLLSSAVAPASYAAEHQHDSILDDAMRAFSEKNLQDAKQYLAAFESQRSRDCAPAVLETFLALKYDVAQQEVLAAGAPSAAALDAYVATYRSVRDRYLQQAAEYRTRADLETYSEKFASYQGLMRDHVRFLQKFQAHAQAIEELYQAGKTFAESQDAFTRPSMVTATNADGQSIQREITLREKYGVLDREQMQQDIIAASRQYMNQQPGGESRAQLIRAYNEYVAAFPAYAKAGLYMNYRMELEGRIDLDALVDIYKKCQFKDTSQYNGSILGLSHLLIDAGRPRDALAFLQQIQTNLLPGSRIAELHYALGNAYELQGDAVNALKHYHAVNTMTRQYADVPRRIEKITGVSSEAFDRMVFDTLADGNNVAARHSTAAANDNTPRAEPAVSSAGGSTSSAQQQNEPAQASIYLQVAGYAAIPAALCCAGLVMMRNRRRHQTP